jgi:uncharacterized membrane protein
VVLSIRRDRTARRVGALAAAGVFLGCWQLLHYWFYAGFQLIDTPTYEGYGRAIRGGLVPYRDFPVEYPPGALPVFVAPTYVGGYMSTFGWLMALCGALCVLLAAVAGARGRSLAVIAVSPLLIGSMALTRFDFWPDLFVVAALAALLKERHRLGWIALGAAVAAKLFALVLVPVVAVYTWRRRGARELLRSFAWGMVVIEVAFIPFAFIAPSGLWHSLRGEASRPLQIESLAATVLTTFGHPTVIASHGSLNLAGQGALAALSSVAVAVALVVLWLAFARGPASGERLIRYSAASICAFVALGKVLSPQFLIWLVPVVPLVRGRRGLVCTGLLVAALVLTDVFFPKRYWDYVYHFDLAWLVLLRNLVLVTLLAALSLPARAREPARNS